MAATTKFGTKAPIKKMFGTKEVLKEVLNGVTVYTNTPPIPLYVTFSSPNTFTIVQRGSRKTWDGSIYYSTDTQHWNTWDGTTTLNSSSTGDTKYLYIRGSGNTYITGNTSDRLWVITGSNISISGNTETLLDYLDVKNGYNPTMGDYAFSYWLASNTNIVDCSNLILGTITLADWCYYGMFDSCTGLITPPVISAATIGNGSCATAFFGCTSLTTAPELPAMILASKCYTNMFNSCQSLTTPPALPATTLANECYKSMFHNCKNLIAVPALPATTLAEKCYQSMFERCAKIKMSTSQTGDYQTPYRIPTTGTGTTATYALRYMFNSTGGTAYPSSINTTYYTSNEVVY